MKYSFVIPVFNRPEEMDELLQSLATQTLQDFEVLVVEDGSSMRSQEVVERHANQMDIKYFFKENEGPGPTRNFGASRCQGEYLIFLDSDCVLPPSYLQTVDDELKTNPCEAFGGPDKAHESFSPVQKAIGYSMTSLLTTGGIRGGKKKLDKFYPRSFNMGIQANLFNQLGGFSTMRFGEDIDLSIRIFESGSKCRLFPEAWVWHKRRTDLKKFFKQVHNSGIARINLMKRHPDSIKLVHMLPAFFTIGAFCLLFMAFLCIIMIGLSTWALHNDATGCVTEHMSILTLSLICLGVFMSPLILFSLIIFTDSSIRYNSTKIGALSIGASFVQLIGYGTGFLRAWWLRCICGRNEELQAFKTSFYK